MGNRTYLTALNERVACPGYRDDFDGEVQTIAETAWHLPLPWLAMFREEDLVEDTYVEATHREPVNFIAPITTRSKAISNLKNAFSHLRSTLHVVSELERYFLLMADELETFQFSFITIDWLELDEPAMHEKYVRDWHDVLRGFDDPKSVEAAHRPSTFDCLLAAFGRRRTHPWLRSINAFTAFSPSQKLPPASAYLDGLDISPEQDKLHANLLPSNVHQRSV